MSVSCRRAKGLAGGIFTMTEAGTSGWSQAAGISKSTGYRYFPSQELMYAEMVLTDTLEADRRQVEAAAASEGDAAARIDRVVRADHALTTKHEHARRTGLHAFLLLIDSSPTSPWNPAVGFRYLTTALAPLANRFSRAEMRRLVAALSLCVGVESVLVTQSICGLSREESEEVKRWAAAALLRAALDDAVTLSSRQVDERPMSTTDG